LDEVLVFNPKPAEELQSVTISYATDGPPAQDTSEPDGDTYLRGPIAVSLHIPTAAPTLYDDTLNDLETTFYQGTYEAEHATLSTTADGAIWYAVSWGETVTDTNNVPLGDIDLDVYCGATAAGNASGIFSSVDGDIPSALNPLDQDPIDPGDP